MSKKNGIIKEMGTLAGGNLLAQSITLVAYFALTRIFSTEDYGLYSIFYSYIDVLIILSTLKYEIAVVKADDDREAAAVAHFTLRINTIVSVVLLTLATLLWLTGWLPERFQELGWMVLLIPPMVFLCGTSRVYSFLFNRFHRYGTMATSETVNSASAAALKIGLGLTGVLQAGMPIGTVAGRAVGNLAYRLRLRQLQLPATSRSDEKAAARKHRNFPLYVATKDFINSLSYNLPFIWLAMYFDHAEIGLFGLALTFTFRPIHIFNNAFEHVLYARTAEAVRNNLGIRRMTLRFLAVLNAIALPLFVCAYFVAEPVFTFFFGGRWSGCGVYVQALLPWIFFMLSSSTMKYISNVFSRQRTEFCFYIALLVLRVAAIAIGIHSGDFLTAIRLYAAAGALVFASLLLWYLYLVERYERTPR